MNQNRIWTIISGALIIAVLALGFFLGVQPELAATQRAQDDREAVEAQNLGLEATLESLAEQAANMSTIESDIVNLRESIPAQMAEPDLLRELDTLASTAGVRLLSYTPQDPVAFLAAPEFEGAIPAGVSGDTFAVRPLSISAQGSYEQAIAFVAGVQTASRLMFVSDVVMTVDEATGQYTVDLTASTYALAEGAQPSAQPTAEPDTEALDQ